jgi:hypothetical protein
MSDYNLMSNSIIRMFKANHAPLSEAQETVLHKVIEGYIWSIEQFGIDVVLHDLEMGGESTKRAVDRDATKE